MKTNEEKPVKQIDFSKPLQTSASKYPVRVVKEGMTVLEYETMFGGTQRVVVDETGAIYAEERARPIGTHGFVVENVPEEPRDHLVLWKADNGQWRIDGDRPYTKANAKGICELWNNSFARPSIVVKVPE